MLWGQKLVVYTDHKNLMQDTLGLTSDHVYDVSSKIAIA